MPYCLFFVMFAIGKITDTMVSDTQALAVIEKGTL